MMFMVILMVISMSLYIYVWFIKDQTGLSDSMDDFYGF
jgi:hypothetical protein